jgi:hypothetical protein
MYIGFGPLGVWTINITKNKNKKIQCSCFMSRNISSIIAWNVAGELHRPKNITVGSNNPWFVLNSVAEVQFRTDPENWNRQNRTKSFVLFCSVLFGSGSLSPLLRSVLSS